MKKSICDAPLSFLPMDRARLLALMATALFALGGVAAWAQEFVVWLPRIITDLLVIAGLVLSVWSLTLVTRRLFQPSAAPVGRELRATVTALCFAALPPLIFFCWWTWARLSSATPL